MGIVMSTMQTSESQGKLRSLGFVCEERGGATGESRTDLGHGFHRNLSQTQALLQHSQEESLTFISESETGLDGPI